MYGKGGNVTDFETENMDHIADETEYFISIEITVFLQGIK